MCQISKIVGFAKIEMCDIPCVNLVCLLQATRSMRGLWRTYAAHCQVMKCWRGRPRSNCCREHPLKELSPQRNCYFNITTHFYVSPTIQRYRLLGECVYLTRAGFRSSVYAAILRENHILKSQRYHLS